MPMEMQRGDLTSLNPRMDPFVIVQQVNCQGVMGAGLAKALMQTYDDHQRATPLIKREYQAYVTRAQEQGQSLLGAVNTTKVGPKAYVCNVFGQEFYGRHGHYTNEKALLAGVGKVLVSLDRGHWQGPVYVPAGIGSGLAGGDAHQIQAGLRQLAQEHPSLQLELVEPGRESLRIRHEPAAKTPAKDEGLEL